MTMTNFEMEPPEAATPPAAKVLVPLWAKITLAGLLVLSVYTLIRAEASVEAQADMQFSIDQIKKELTWTKEKRQLLSRVAAAEKGEKALKAELGRVYANLQGKNYTPPEDPDDDGEDRPESPARFDYNSCTEDEHLALCALVQQDRDNIIQKSRSPGHVLDGSSGKTSSKGASCRRYPNCRTIAPCALWMLLSMATRLQKLLRDPRTGL